MDGHAHNAGDRALPGTLERREASRAYALWPDNTDSRFVLAERRFQQGRLDEAQSLLDTLLAIDPTDKDASTLRERIIADRAGRGAGRPAP